MLSSITPLGERGRNARWPLTITYYLIGSVLGGCLIGLTAGLSGELLALIGTVAGVSLPPVVRLGVLAVAALAGALLDLPRWRSRLPTIHRQVNEDWLDTYRPWVYGGGFGFQLGLGVVTIVTSASVYLLLLLIVLTGSWPAGLGLGALFGLARALPILRMRTVTSPDRLTTIFRRLSAAEPRARRTVIASQIAIAAATALYMATSLAS